MPRNSGNAWMAAGEAWLRDHIWPHVGRQRSPGMGDFTGTWDLNVEATIVPWSTIWVKLRQSERDARNRGLDLSCVWKKHNRSEEHLGPVGMDPGDGAVVMFARQFFPLMARLEKLEARALHDDDAFTRGWAAHAKHMIEVQRKAVEEALG